MARELRSAGRVYNVNGWGTETIAGWRGVLTQKRGSRRYLRGTRISPENALIVDRCTSRRVARIAGEVLPSVLPAPRDDRRMGES